MREAALERALEAALHRAGLRAAIRSRRPLSGGCINRVFALSLEDGTTLVAKVNRAEVLPAFVQEAAGLEALATTRTVLVPRPLAATVHEGAAVLLVTALRRGPADERTWRSFGQELARLHSAAVAPEPGGYGFAADNRLGGTEQPNGWCEDWVEFNATRRLGHQLRLARERGRLARDQAGAVERVIERLDALLPRRPPRALLHGDLWSGNAIPALGERGEPRIGLLDPACSIGDGWADIAMMRLFGGFPETCLREYAGVIGDREEPEGRIAVYQLYHVLNHANMFGGAYAAQAESLAREALSRAGGQSRP